MAPDMRRPFTNEELHEVMKKLPSYNAAKVEMLVKELAFATEAEAAIALFNSGWDMDKAWNALVYNQSLAS